MDGHLEAPEKLIGDKRRWWQYKARTKKLPEGYRTAVEALERYLMVFGPGEADSMMAMFDDLADLFEQAAADSSPIRDIVGDDPVEFAETFLADYTGRGWVDRERERLQDGIGRAEQQQATEGPR